MSSLHNLDNKPSSRVLAAPGGKSSNIFGTDSSSGDARPGRRLDPNASKTSNIFDDSSNYSRPSRGTRSEVSEALNVSSPRGPAGLDDSKSPKKPSVRVHAPPGGQTSNIFGSNSDNSQSRGGRARVGNNDPNASSMGGSHEVSNTGNVDARPSSRVTHAPGGGSSNIFGSDAPVQKGGRARVGNNDSNQSSLGHEQVSSTSNIDAKPSSRVLSAPGGASSNIFGTDAPVERKGRAKVGSNDANSTSIEFGASDAKPSSRVSQAPGGKSSNIFSSDAPVERRGRAKVGGNDANAQSSTDLSVSERPVSRTNLSSNDGPSASSESAGPEARKAHVKVHAPPGGKSSNIFGTD